MEFLRSILWPLTEAMRILLEGLTAVVGGHGVAIMLLSVIVTTLLSPVTKLARRYEAADRLRQDRMADGIAEAKATTTGRERFERIDAIYKEHNYHPIKSMASLLPLFVQLPFLLAALFLLTDYPAIQGERFGPIPDLSRPDALVTIASQPLNVLPILLTLVAVVEALVGPESTRQSRLRFFVVAVVLLVLIYPLPSAVCLYWLTSNLMSFLRSLMRRRLSHPN